MRASHLKIDKKANDALQPAHSPLGQQNTAYRLRLLRLECVCVAWSPGVGSYHSKGRGVYLEGLKKLTSTGSGIRTSLAISTPPAAKVSTACSLTVKYGPTTARHTHPLRRNPHFVHLNHRSARQQRSSKRAPCSTGAPIQMGCHTHTSQRTLGA